MANSFNKIGHDLTAEYSDAIALHGPHSSEAKTVRDAHVDDADFLAFADSIDRIKESIGGSGIDYPAGTFQGLTHELIERYSDAVALHGPDSSQAKQVRENNAKNQTFITFANSIDEIKKTIGGAGMDRVVPQHDDR